MKVLSRFMLSAVAPEHFPPPELPEVAFLGRSNVGKSSLINSLVSAKIAKTSNTPGRTQTINFFEIRWPGPAPFSYALPVPGRCQHTATSPRYAHDRVPAADPSPHPRCGHQGRPGREPTPRLAQRSQEGTWG